MGVSTQSTWKQWTNSNLERRCECAVQIMLFCIYQASMTYDHILIFSAPNLRSPASRVFSKVHGRSSDLVARTRVAHATVAHQNRRLADLPRSGPYVSESTFESGSSTRW